MWILFAKSILKLYLLSKTRKWLPKMDYIYTIVQSNNFSYIRQARFSNLVLT